MFFEYLKENPVLTAVLCAALAIIVIAVIALCVKSSKARKSREETEKTINENPADAAKPIISDSSAKDNTDVLADSRSDSADDKSDVGDVATRETVPGETDGTEPKNPAPTEQDHPTAEKVQNEIYSSVSEQDEKKDATEEKSVTQSETADTEGSAASLADTETKEKTDSRNEKDAEESIPETEQIPAVKEDAAQKDNEKAAEEETAARATTAEEKSAEKEKKRGKNKSKEGKMDIEDLKNAPIEEADEFYDEDDENDKIARYSGKWVICRVVTAGGKGSDELKEDGDEMFFFELRASNGEKLLTSEEYTTYNGALNGIETHKANIERGNFKIMLSKKGDYIFKLLSGKNMLLCMGEHYATKARCESAIASAKRFAKTAIVDENVQDIVITPPPEEDEEELPEIPDNGYNGKWIVRAHTAEDGEQVFYFELFASNGEKLLSSEEYTTYIGAINGIGTHKTNIERGNFRISLTKRGDYIYKLLNGNGQLLCLGEHYKTKRRCENAIESVKRFAKNAPILSDPETVNKNA